MAINMGWWALDFNKAISGRPDRHLSNDALKTDEQCEESRLAEGAGTGETTPFIFLNLPLVMCSDGCWSLRH